jgi:hypothetical protein
MDKKELKEKIVELIEDEDFQKYLNKKIDTIIDSGFVDLENEEAPKSIRVLASIIHPEGIQHRRQSGKTERTVRRRRCLKSRKRKKRKRA